MASTGTASFASLSLYGATQPVRVPVDSGFRRNHATRPVRDASSASRREALPSPIRYRW